MNRLLKETLQPVFLFLVFFLNTVKLTYKSFACVESCNNKLERVCQRFSEIPNLYHIDSIFKVLFTIHDFDGQQWSVEF